MSRAGPTLDGASADFVRTSMSSGKKIVSSARCKNFTPDVPPVPALPPMMRSTVFM